MSVKPDRKKGKHDGVFWTLMYCSEREQKETENTQLSKMAFFLIQIGDTSLSMYQKM